jgi:hypothetical protein
MVMQLTSHQFGCLQRYWAPDDSALTVETRNTQVSKGVDKAIMFAIIPANSYQAINSCYVTTWRMKNTSLLLPAD